MAYVWQRWLAREFRAAGLKVVEVQGWENRGRPASTGSFDPDEATITHHTGTRSGPDNNAPSLSVLISGRSDLPGPLCQWAVAYDGTVYVVAAGRANHAGSVGKSGVPGMPLGADGNALSLGDEVMTDGTQQLPEAQRHAIAVTNAVALKHHGNGADRAYRHQTISGTGKWDIGSLTDQQVQSDAAQAMGGDLTSEDTDMQLTDDIYAAKGKKLTVRELFHQLDRFMANSAKRDQLLLRTVNQATEELERAVDAGASQAELRKMLGNLRRAVIAAQADEG